MIDFIVVQRRGNVKAFRNRGSDVAGLITDSDVHRRVTMQIAVVRGGCGSLSYIKDKSGSFLLGRRLIKFVARGHKAGKIRQS